MKNIKDMDYEESIAYEVKLDDLWDSVEALKDDAEFMEISIDNMEWLDSFQDYIDITRKDVQEQRRLNEEAGEMQRDTLSDDNNSK